MQWYLVMHPFLLLTLLLLMSKRAQPCNCQRRAQGKTCWHAATTGDTRKVITAFIVLIATMSMVPPLVRWLF